MSNEFDYDETTSAAATTIQDRQGASDNGSDDDGYGALDGVGADLKTPQAAKTKCVGFCSAPRVIDKTADSGTVFVSVTFTCVEPPELAGRTDDLFGPVSGGDSAGRQRHLEALNKLCGKVGATWDPNSLRATLAGLKRGLNDAGATIGYTLAKGKKGGTFINL